MKKQIKTYIANIQNIALLYALFTFTERTYNFTKWSETMPETFAFYALVLIIFTYMIKFK